MQVSFDKQNSIKYDKNVPLNFFYKTIVTELMKNMIRSLKDNIKTNMLKIMFYHLKFFTYYKSVFH